MAIFPTRRHPTKSPCNAAEYGGGQISHSKRMHSDWVSQGCLQTYLRNTLLRDSNISVAKECTFIGSVGGVSQHHRTLDPTPLTTARTRASDDWSRTPACWPTPEHKYACREHNSLTQQEIGNTKCLQGNTTGAQRPREKSKYGKDHSVLKIKQGSYELHFSTCWTPT